MGQQKVSKLRRLFCCVASGNSYPIESVYQGETLTVNLKQFLKPGVQRCHNIKHSGVTQSPKPDLRGSYWGMWSHATVVPHLYHSLHRPKEWWMYPICQWSNRWNLPKCPLAKITFSSPARVPACGCTSKMLIRCRFYSYISIICGYHSKWCVLHHYSTVSEITFICLLANITYFTSVLVETGYWQTT